MQNNLEKQAIQIFQKYIKNKSEQMSQIRSHKMKFMKWQNYDLVTHYLILIGKNISNRLIHINTRYLSINISYLTKKILIILNRKYTLK